MLNSIVNADISHVERILEIENTCFSTPFTREQVISQLPDERHVFLACVNENGDIMGYVGMMFVLDEGYISNVAVAPEYRRKGLADGLINVLKERAKQLELSFVTLEVRESNEPARALYKKHGFSDVGRRKNYYTLPSEDAILMTCYLK